MKKISYLLFTCLILFSGQSKAAAGGDVPAINRLLEGVPESKIRATENKDLTKETSTEIALRRDIEYGEDVPDADVRAKAFYALKERGLLEDWMEKEVKSVDDLKNPGLMADVMPVAFDIVKNHKNNYELLKLSYQLVYGNKSPSELNWDFLTIDPKYITSFENDFVRTLAEIWKEKNPEEV